MRRKKQLLFDVLDDIIEPRDRYDRQALKPEKRAKKAARAPAQRKASKSTAGRKEKPKSKASKPKTRTASLATVGEGIRMSYSMAAAVLFVLAVLVGVAYQFGFDHGDKGVFSREVGEIPMRQSGARDLGSEHYAVRVANIAYRPGLFEAAVERATELTNFLAEMGYADAIGVPIEDESRAGHGTIIIWAGHAEESKSLEADASKLRSVVFQGNYPFDEAYIQLFWPVKSR